MTEHHRRRALIRFALEQQIRGGRWFLAIILFVLMLSAGVRLMSDPQEMFIQGILVGMIVALNYGIAFDRRRGFDLFLTNLAAPRAILLWKALVSLGFYVLFCVFGFLVAAVLWRDPSRALWFSVHSFLVLSIILSLAFVAEILVDFEAPVIIATLVWMVASLSFGLAVPAETVARAIDFLGLSLTVGSFSGFGRLLLVTTLWNAAAVAIGIGIWNMQSRHRVARTRA